jgi:hypothetical protein
MDAKFKLYGMPVFSIAYLVKPEKWMPLDVTAFRPDPLTFLKEDRIYSGKIHLSRVMLTSDISAKFASHIEVSVGGREKILINARY